MVKKNSRKESEIWSCEQGCPQTNTPCVHLEALLPGQGKDRRGGTSVPMSFVGGLIESYEDDAPSTEEILRREKRFRSVLRQWGVSEEGVELLFAKFVQKLSIEEIAQQQGYVDRFAARYFYRKLLRQLKQSGFKVKKGNSNEVS